MGCTARPFLCSCQIRRAFLLSLLVPLLSIPLQIQGGRLMKDDEKKSEEMVLLGGALMGSRPPSCEMRSNRCRSHCEAVQVPATTVDDQSSVDKRSNYKPMKWKCKCGNRMFNP
ncbi:EPIDERMAL PATTERNING FACTOR-like protein 2 [Zingiber officinale]|nr:EPIDERMAL PATTERNING FACTOR-like protein 2 [Zingiber officinale]XP_042414675.1 EPIDERMAL PATTERNING FACTOR-like protein 2 [Zingiber officinale]